MAKNIIGPCAIVNRGPYDSSKTYYILNMVVYNGGVFICKKDEIQGIEPTQGENWINCTVGIKNVSESIDGINHTYTIEFTNGDNYSFTIKDGYTPIKGTDYYTPEDIESLDIPRNVSDLNNDVNYSVTNANNNFSTAQTINGTLTINGDIVQNGSSYETHAEQVYTRDDLIITRDGAVGGLSENEVTGVKALKYDGTNNSILGVRSDGTAVVGDENGVLEPLATRKEDNLMQNGKLVKWNSSTLQLETDDGNEVIKSTYLTGTQKPISSTVGFVGQLYINTSNNRIYQCTSIENGIYNWILITDKIPTTLEEYEQLTEIESDVFYFCTED